MSDLFIFKTAVRDLLRAKRVIASLILIAAPSSIALLWRFAAADAFDPYDAYNTLSSVVVYGFLLVILSVVFGTGVISQEIEQKTIVYLLTRPVPRWRIVLMKFLAAVTGIIVTVIASSLLLAAVTFASGGEQSSTLRQKDIRNRDNFLFTLNQRADPVSEYLHSKMDERTRNTLRNSLEPPAAPQPERTNRRRGPHPREVLNPQVKDRALRRALRSVNRVLETDRNFYNEERFPELVLNDEAKQLIALKPTAGKKLAHLNRVLLQLTYPDIIAPRPEPVFPLTRDLIVLPVGALAYGALFLLLATLLNRPLMYGLVFAFGWESWVPNLPGKFQMVSIMTYLRALSPHPQPAAESVDLLQFLSGGNQTVISQGLARGVLIGVIVVALTIALVIFSSNEYVPREDAE
jgi:hypothetical protein